MRVTRLAWGLAGAAVLALACVALLITSAGPAAAAGGSSPNPPIFSQPVDYGAPGYTTVEPFASTCTGAGDCVAVGRTEPENQTTEVPVIVASQNGSWGSPVSLTAPSSSGMSAEYLSSVACSSATSCVAALTGDSQLSMISFTLSGNTVTSVSTPSTVAFANGTPDGVFSVACGSTCFAVGGYADASGNQSPVLVTQGANGWNEIPVDYAGLPADQDGDGAYLNAVSCPPGGDSCEAVGSSNATGSSGSAATRSYPWAVSIDPSTGSAAAATPVSEPAGASGYPALAPTIVLVKGGLSGVSCPSAGACTAAGSFQDGAGAYASYALAITNGSPQTPVELTPPAPGDSALLQGISCWDAQDCAVAGDDDPASSSDSFPMVGSETDASWSQLASEPLGGGQATSITFGPSCPVAQSCLVAGIAIPAATNGTTTGYFLTATPGLSVATTSLPGATVGVAYSAQLQAAGGIGSDTWSVASGQLPAGLSLNSATGAISGTPTAAGSDGFVSQVNSSGSQAQTADGPLSITVQAAAGSGQTTTVTVPTRTVAVPVGTSTAPARLRLPALHTVGTRAEISLGCFSATCTGKLVLSAYELVHGKRLVKLQASRRVHARAVTLLRGSYRLTANSTRTLTVRLPHGIASQLKRLRVVSVELTLTPSGSRRAVLTGRAIFRS